jgi:DNA-binding NarL/FixJ family response regulator
MYQHYQEKVHNPRILQRRHRQIARILLSSGDGNLEIAKQIGLSPASVNQHVFGLLNWAGASSRLEFATLVLNSKQKLSEIFEVAA